jgi:hypothetical protein
MSSVDSGGTPLIAIRRHEAGVDRREHVADVLAWSVLGTLALAAVVLAMFVAVARRDRSPLAGEWVGRDAQRGEVLYRFGSRGRGYRVLDGVRADLTYHLSRGYPNELEVVVASDGDTTVYRGLVQIVSESEIRLELGPPGEPGPQRLGAGALVLHPPPSR